MTSLAGKTALITGATGGLGWHFSQVLAREGAHVIMCGRQTELLLEQARVISSAGGLASTKHLDVISSISIDGLKECLGKVDVVVNNAGIVHNGSALDQTEQDWNLVIDTNLKGVFLVAQAAGRAMRDRGRGGSIINIASVLGLRQAGGVLPYAVSKAGLIQLTKILALEWARFGIRVNALAPGYLETQLNRQFFETDAGKALINRIPQRRLGRLDDLDGPLLLLASDSSAYMTGSVLAIDGGHLVSGL
jgi:NAD(P)-dependent dehydrogenase (short-subunit alcohol dehydrogenase family)